MAEEFRCPACNRVTAAETLMYSASLDQFVCPRCHAIEFAKSKKLAPTEPSPLIPEIPAEPERRVILHHTSMEFLALLVLVAVLITAGGIYFFARMQSSGAKPQAATKPALHAVVAVTRPAAAIAQPQAAAPATRVASAAPVQSALPSPPRVVEPLPHVVPIAPPRPALQPAPPAPAAAAVQYLDYPRGPVSDQQIGESIQRAVDFLLAHFENDEISVPERMSDARTGGLDALAVYALAVSSKAIVDQRISPKGERMNAMLEKLKAYKFETSEEPRTPLTYARSLRACALATFNRPQDRAVLEDDVDWLVQAATAGSYTYTDVVARTRGPRKQRRKVTTKPATGARTDASSNVAPFLAPAQPASTQSASDNPPPRIFQNKLPKKPAGGPDSRRDAVGFDNSNSQYGLLGVWAGAEVGCEVADNYWRLVQRHWESCQLPTGQWNYSGDDRGGSFAMTVAGIASLLVTHDYLEAPLLNPRVITARQPYSIPLSAGLAWLEEGDHAVTIQDQGMFYSGYNLFGMERVGLASGFKQFGGHDWFIELASRSLPSQRADGAFGEGDSEFDTVVDTCYMLLFLSRGRHPIMINKLRYDGAWTNRPREIANLTAYTARELERPMNWQVVDITRGAADWADAPVLYISGNKAVEFNEADRTKLRDYANNGGLIFTHADLGAEPFNRSIEALAKQLFPDYAYADLPADHAVYSVNYPIATPRPRLQGISNGVRLLMVHSPADLSSAWQTRSSLSRKEPFQLGANLYLYATGKEKFRNRLDTPTVPEPTQAPLRTIEMARLKYVGNWNPEPGAWPRFSRILEWHTGAKLDVNEIEIEKLRYAQTPIAHLTGTDAFTPSEAQLTALKDFVSNGGTLLIDAAGGSGPFADAEASWLPKILGEHKLKPVADTDPLLRQTIPGTFTVPAKTLRLFALEQLRTDTSRLKSATVGKGRIVFSALDLSSGLLGTNTWGVLGYLPEYSESVAQNLVITAH